MRELIEKQMADIQKIFESRAFGTKYEFKLLKLKQKYIEMLLQLELQDLNSK